MTARPIFIGGTGSHAGKSWVATAICRYLHLMGNRVAPFKAQNMSNNSAVCPDGGEIGRAQAAQAEACGLEPHADMNPILLKPTGEMGSQVVLNGRPWMNLRASQYYDHFDFLFEKVLESYGRLSANYDYVVIEGAGSVTELNLKNRDLVNLGLARRLQAPSLLVADIDRGGVFASVVGTFSLLDTDELSLLHAFLINRFRGDSSLFRDGVRILEERTQRPCLGVFPFVPDIELDAEDSLSLDGRPARPLARVAIVRLPHISNFTDFSLLDDAAYVTQPVNTQFDAVILPGTKSTIEDMQWLRESGMERWLLEQHARGSRIIGVCGGYQMLGEEIVDPHGVESPIASIRGLALLPVSTQLARWKTTRCRTAQTPSGIPFSGYEIHMGITTSRTRETPFAILDDGSEDGMRLRNIAGTYLHGALESKGVIEELLGHPVAAVRPKSKIEHYDRLATWFAENVNQDLFQSRYLQQKESPRARVPQAF